MEHPLTNLSREDLDLVMELVLKSGSIKDLALSYGVSYPTMRTRLDRVIERLEAVRAGKPPDELTLLLAHLVERGELAPGTARTIRDKARDVQNRSAHPGGNTQSGGSQ
jgi:hypothetical protein